MKTRTIALFAAALMSAVAFAGNASAQGTTTTPPTTVAPERPPLPDGLKDLLENFKDQRADIIAARQALLEKLKTATEAERKALIEAFKKDQELRIRAERELRKSIREEQKKLRDERRRAAAGG